MTVKELIDQLTELPPDVRVFVWGMDKYGYACDGEAVCVMLDVCDRRSGIGEQVVWIEQDQS